MKSVLSFIFLVGFGVNIFAQNSNLTIFSEDGLPFYLILNGIRQNEAAETNVRVDGLVNDYYSTKIIFQDQNIEDIERKVLMVVDADRQKGGVTYKIKKTNKGKIVLRYYSFTPAAQVLPPLATVAVVHYNTKPMVAIDFNSTTISTTTTTTHSSTSDNVNVNMNIGGVNMGASVYVNDGGSHTDISTTTTTITTTNIPQDVAYYEEEITCSPMGSSSFLSATKSIEEKSFADSQLSQAKQITQSNCLTAEQIKTICKIFSFEDSKLEFAKFAYQYCYDQNNYWKVNDAFTFDSSISELNNFLKK